MISVVVIDDSAFMRKALSIMLESDPAIKVLATARDGQEGFDFVKKYQPDAVTLDIEMPRTNGFECLEMIMAQQPTPVLVVSSLSKSGAQTTLEALERGAVDYIPKTKSYVAIDIIKIQDELICKIKAVVKNNKHRSAAKRFTKTISKFDGKLPDEKPLEFLNLSDTPIKCIAIGVSTGGPPIVHKILESLPGDYPPVLVAQHMPEQFTGSFASRINLKSAINVKEAVEGNVITRGNAYIARGGNHLIIKRNGGHIIGVVTPNPENAAYHPSVNILMESTSNVYGSGTLGIILTGMGKDGVDGLKLLKERGGKIIAQDKESSVVYGMPKVAAQQKLPDAVLSVEGIIASLKTITS